MFLESERLRATGLHWMINRGQLYKRAHGTTFTKLEKMAANDRKKAKHASDQAKLAKTQMRKEREAAMQRLLESGDGVDNSGLICAAPSSLVLQSSVDVEENGGSPTSSGLPCLEWTKVQLPADAGEQEASLHRIRKCHICKHAYDEVHHFYCSLCPTCSALNWTKRHQNANLNGRTVLLTGSRIKIGQQICLSLLRSGATVIATTRFPVDMQQRFAEMADFAEWGHRLHIYRVDLRNLGLVTAFCHFLRQRYQRLYAIINNAAQTVARPRSYYAHLVQKEVAPPAITGPAPAVPAEWESFVRARVGVAYDSAAVTPKLTGASLAAAPVLEGTPQDSLTVISPTASSSVSTSDPKEWFDMYDTWQASQDTRTQNSWTQELGDISGEEAAEVHAINALAPFIINSALKPLLLACDEGETEAERQRFVINVSAMEGQFYRFKTPKHPHTNMAKASLNMMTRTAAQGYAADGIFMNAVDTGWITDENPKGKAEERYSRGLTCPLDEVDAAARVLDLVYTKSREFGKFWKDYREIPW
eukprot:EG_transcript_8281